ncbi:hypothetical protein Sste5346_006787 [Sporothrix stenoceras]|uniref:Uncharacterized protein n=1 Tax=Sporothrix stenoceras TaxID=5173 RepID=A0ABR3Z018_9PEZI
MADYNHRRAASELVSYRQAADGTIYRQERNHVSQRPGSSGALFANSTPRMHNKVYVDGNKYANTNFHFRSQSYESPYSWDSYVGGEIPVSAPPTGHSRYGSLVPPEVRAQHMQLALPNSQRRGSESSTSSAISNCTATAGGPSAWSAATTPEAMSPTSPNNSLLLQSPPERTSSKAGPVIQAPPPSPSKTPNHAPQQAFIPCRSARARALSHSAPKRFQNTAIESPVPEEEEQTETRRNSGRLHQKHASHEVNMAKEPAAQPFVSLTEEEAKAVSNLRQRRQQRQLKMTGTPQKKQPVRLRLTPLPPLPLDQQSSRLSCAPSPRTLKSSRSSPQLRDAAGPPPTGPLPPLPGAPNLSQLPPPTPRTPSMPPTPSFANSNVRPPHPTVPPPPPPSRQSVESPGLLSPRRVSPSAEPTPVCEGPQEQGTPWEEELRRHKKLLEQFPTESEERRDLPKLSRSHRSLGNIRARSRSLSRATGVSFHDDAAIAENRLSHHASSFSLRGSKTMRPSTAKSSKDVDHRSREVQPSQSQVNAPHISVFEDDSDEEGDTVRKFVRNLFTRRTRSGEVPLASPNATEYTREVSSGSKHSVSSGKSTEGNGHNDRKKNHSSSSNFSIATTVGGSTVVSTTTSLDPSSAETYHDSCDVEYHAEGNNSTSPRTSSDHSRQHQKGPLLSRMFVRRSH